MHYVETFAIRHGTGWMHSHDQFKGTHLQMLCISELMEETDEGFLSHTFTGKTHDESADLRGVRGEGMLLFPTMSCRVFNSLLCTLAVWVACLDGHACAQRGQRRTLFALSYPSLLHFPDTESLSEAKAKQRPANPSAPPCYVLPIGRVTDARQPWAPSWIVGAGICTCDLMISS